MSLTGRESVSCFLCTTTFSQSSSRLHLNSQMMTKFARFVAQLNDESESSQPTISDTFQDDQIRHACPKCRFLVESVFGIYQKWRNLGKRLDSTLDEIEEIFITTHVTVLSEGQLDLDMGYDMIGNFLRKAREKRRKAIGRNWLQPGENQDNQSSDDYAAADDDDAHSETSSHNKSKMASKCGNQGKPETGAPTLLPHIVPNESEEDIILIETQAQSDQQEEALDRVTDQSESKKKTEKRKNQRRSLSHTQSKSPTPTSSITQQKAIHCKQLSDTEEKQAEIEKVDEVADCQFNRPPLKMVLRRKHLEHQEEMRKPIRCHFCEKMFKKQETLNRHVKRYHYEQQRNRLKQLMRTKLEKILLRRNPNSEKVNSMSFL